MKRSLLLSILIPFLAHFPAMQNPATGAVNAGMYPGPDWISRVNAAALALERGGTVEVPDSLAGSASTIGVIPSGVALHFTGAATFGFCEIRLGKFSKIYGRGALLQMTAPNCGGVRQQNHADLQATDKFLIDGLRIDCAQQPGTTGIFIGSTHAQAAMRDMTVANCTTGLWLEGAQFGEYANVSLYHNETGLKLYSTMSGGGGNSNTFYGLKAVGNTVGVLIADIGVFGMGPNYFLNPSLLSNSVAAMAVFGNRVPSEVHWYGGAPEVNGSGPEAIRIDGRLIKRSTIYANLARITLTEVEIEEAKINPVIRAENSSAITLNNVSGYGRWDGTLVSADHGSSTSLQGRLEVLGTIENVVSYPALLSSSGYVRMFGAPARFPESGLGMIQERTFIKLHPVDFRGSFATGEGRDPAYGSVITVHHAPEPGSQEKNRINFGNVVESDGDRPVLATVLLKSNVDCLYNVGAYADGYSRTRVPLLANHWKRVVILQGKSTGKKFMLIGWPEDARGPIISFAGLQVMATPSGVEENQNPMKLVSGESNSN